MRSDGWSCRSCSLTRARSGSNFQLRASRSRGFRRVGGILLAESRRASPSRARCPQRVLHARPDAVKRIRMAPCFSVDSQIRARAARRKTGHPTPGYDAPNASSGSEGVVKVHPVTPRSRQYALTASCVNEDELPTAAVRSAVDHGVIRYGAPKRGEGRPMEAYYPIRRATGATPWSSARACGAIATVRSCMCRVRR